MTDADRAALAPLLARWRDRLRTRDGLSDDAVDELESHLLDEVDHLLAHSLPLRQAFFEAAARLGHEDGLRTEYRKLRGRTPRGGRWHRLTDGPALAGSYVRVAVRALRRHRGYALLNLTGLAVGLAACLVIGLFVRHKLSYDRHLPNHDRAYRLYAGEPGSGFTNLPSGLGPFLADRHPEIEHLTVMHPAWRQLVTIDGEARYEEGIATADEHFLDVFPYRVLARGEAVPLGAPGQLVLTRSTAERFFGSADAVGRILTLDGNDTRTVVAVIEDPPAATHFPFAALKSPHAATRTADEGDGVDWASFAGTNYLTLHEGTDVAALEARIRAWERESRASHWLAEQDGTDPQLRLMPVPDIHLHSRLPDDVAPQSDVRYVYLFSAAALLILLLACVNYMNLATARSAGRAREVGVRKAVGAHRGQLIGQFLAESVVLALLALPLALGLAWLARPLIERVAGAEVPLSPLADGPLVLALVAVVLGVGVLAGTYPAFFLSRFRPTQVLTGGSASLGRGGARLRRALVVVQFAATVVLLVGTVAVQRQLDYLQDRRLGYETETVVTFTNYDGASTQYEAFREELRRQPSVAAAAAGRPPGIGSRSMLMWRPVDPADPEGEQQLIDVLAGDYGYLETLGIEPIAGRRFDPTQGDTPDNALILTRSALPYFDATLASVGSLVEVGDASYRLVGVVEDLHNESLRTERYPAVVQLETGRPWAMLVRLQPGNLRAGLDEVAAVWDVFVPERPFDFEFLDARIAAQYEAEQRLGQVFVVFSLLAVFVACLGLFGLAAFTAEQRTKEIGVRKVLGASAASIVVLLSKDYARLVAIAFVLGAPPAYLLARRWLEDFAYRIELSWGLFAAAGGLALAVALLATGYQAFRASRANPVEALRYE